MDVFRSQYRQLTPEEVKRLEEIKALAASLNDRLVRISGQGGREIALARTKLEECVMWATKGITS